MQMTILWRALPGVPEREARDAFVRRALGQARFLRLAREPGGKPFLPPAADDPRPPHLSLTHTRGLIACALFDAPVGVDAEPADRQVAAALARRICRNRSARAMRRCRRRRAARSCSGAGWPGRRTASARARALRAAAHISW